MFSTTDTTTRTANPPNYYTVNDLNNPMAVSKTAMRKAEHLFWDQHIPDEDTDHELAVATLNLATGESRYRINNLILAFYQLGELPRLNALQHELFHLDLGRLIAITHALFGLNPEHLPTVDEHLTVYLTPTAPNQALPSTHSLKRTINSIRDMLDDPRAAGTEEKKEFTVAVGTDGTADLYATVTDIDGRVIADAVNKQAAATGKTEAEALVDLILDNIAVKVTLNLYKANDLADAPVWANGIGWLDAQSGERWTERATRTQDMDEAMDKHLAGHDPCHAIKAAVEGRDGICRFPGCNVPAIRCDSDHRINHADGGPTCVHNLTSLCRHHHNDKTAGRIKYFMDPATGIVIWLLADGTWAVTVPEGPLTPKSARWAQTVSQYRTTHRKRWAAAAQREAENTEVVQDDEPPF